jgi:hypothetical protein
MPSPFVTRECGPRSRTAAPGVWREQPGRGMRSVGLAMPAVFPSRPLSWVAFLDTCFWGSPCPAP